MLCVNNISFHYSPDSLILNDVSFSVSSSEVVSIVGESGVGKSTLLKIISGKLQANEGTVFLENKRIKGPKEQLLSGDDDVVMVCQLFESDEYFTVRENIHNVLLNLEEKERARFSEELIQLLDLKRVENNKSGTLSGGEKQRLSMACALAKEPKVLLLDEPFSHLDVHLRKRVGKYLKELVALREMIVVLVTHEGSEALAWSSKIYFIENGKIKRNYTPEKAYYAPKNLKEGRFFGELNSFVRNGKQILFRPSQYVLEGEEKNKIGLKFKYAEFRGPFYANFFSLASGKEVVLYNENCLKELTHIYVC